MVTEVLAAVLVVLVVVPLARHVAKQHVTRGPFLNLFEAMALFIRDQVARPAIGGHGADAFLPFLWTVFFFVLFNNLLGLIPGMASATGNINVTAAMALMTLATVLIAGMRELGVAGFWVGIVPHMDVPAWLKPFLWTLMFVIEVSGLLIRHVVLAVRLFANMFAGHMVLAVILGFILMAWNSNVFYLGVGHAGEHRGRDPAEPSGIVRGILASVHFHLLVGAVHRLGGASALTCCRRRVRRPTDGRRSQRSARFGRTSEAVPGCRSQRSLLP